MNALLFIATTFAPCAEAPPGMVCIPGGPAIVGSDDGPVAERPKRSIDISTFYLDARETTQSEYDQCVKAGACEQLPKIPPKLEAAFRQPNVPAVSVDWYRADKYCRWAGKRLPTEWEWEKAARGPSGDTYSWGNDAPSCDKAHFRECAPKKGECVPMFGKKTTWDCIEHATKPVGSFAPGHYGLYDMGGTATNGRARGTRQMRARPPGSTPWVPVMAPLIARPSRSAKCYAEALGIGPPTKPAEHIDVQNG